MRKGSYKQNEMVTKSEMIAESMVLRGVNGQLKWVTYVGTMNNQKLYQVDHDWLFGKWIKKKNDNCDNYCS
jgi:hypothetical protein